MCNGAVQPDPRDVLRIARWAVAKRHRHVSRYAAAVLGMSWGDFVQDGILSFYSRGIHRYPDVALTTLVSRHVLWSILHRLKTNHLHLRRDTSCDVLHIAANDNDYFRDSDIRQWWMHESRFLHPRQRTVIEMLYGIGCDICTLAECARQFRVSWMAIKYIADQTTDKLRRRARCSRKTLAILKDVYGRDIFDILLENSTVQP